MGPSIRLNLLPGEEFVMAEKKIEDKAACMQECIADWLNCERSSEGRADCREKEKSCLQECRDG